jgi:serine/threonine protein kinase
MLGLMYMHQMNILHLDVKAANILLTEEAVVKLADFGVSQVLKVHHLLQCGPVKLSFSFL